MKKRHLLLCLLVMLVGVATSAFAGDGLSRADAIDFNLKSQTLKQGAEQLWYKVDLSSFATDEAIQLVVSNQSGEDVLISASVYNDLSATTATVAISETAPVGGNKTVTIPAGLNQLYPQIFLLLSSDQAVAISANAVPTEPGVGCKFPVEMAFTAATKNWDPIDIDAFETKTLRVDGLQTLKGLAPEPIDGVSSTVWGLKVYVKNLGTDEANVTASISLSCGAPLQDISKIVPAGETKSTVIKYSMVQQLKADSVFVDASSDQNIKIWLEADAQIATMMPGANLAVEVFPNTPVETKVAEDNADSTNQRVEKHWFKFAIDKAAKMSKDSVLKIIYTNKSANALVISEKYKYTDDNLVVMSEDKYNLPANGSASHSFSPSQLKQLNTDTIWYFIDADKKGNRFGIEWKLTVAEPGSICRTGIPYAVDSDPNNKISFTHNSSNTVWYKLDYAAALAINNGAVKISIKNNAAVAGTINADVKFDCDGAATPQAKGIAANQTLTKTISHAVLESFTGSEVFIGVTADVPLTLTAQLVYEALSEDRACLESTPVVVSATDDVVFNFTTSKLDTAWYYVDLAAIKADPKDLKVTVEGEGAIKLDGGLAFSCPATSIQTKSLSFSNKYEKQIAYSQIKDLKNPYVRVIGSKSVKVTLTPVAPETHVIDLCNDASVIELDAPTAAPITRPANDSVWYHIDLNAIRALLAGNRVFVKHSQDAQVFEVASTSVCNNQYALSYQKQSRGNELDNNTEITADRLELAGDAAELWVNVKSQKGYTFEIVVEAIPEGQDCEHAEAFKVATDYAQGADVKWYSVDIAALQALGKNGTLTLKNLDNAKTSVKATVYTKCGGAELGSQTITLAANETKVKTAGLAGYPDNVIVRLESTGSIAFRVDLTNETGAECGEAILFDWENGHTLAGQSSTWLNVKFAGNVTAADQVIVHILNLSAKSNNVFGGVAYNCAEGLSQNTSRTLGGHAEQSKDITSLIGSTDSVLVYVYPGEAVRVWAEKITQTPLDEPIVVCNAATPVTYNVWYDVKAGVADQWFAVNVKDLKANTIGDGLFRIQAAEDANFKAEVAYHCPILYPMSSKTLSVKGGEEYNRDVKRSDINGVKNDSVYIRVTTDKDAKFQFQIQDLAGFDCEHAIEYEWATVVEHPAFGTKWYKIPFSDINNDPAVGLKAVFTNKAGNPFKMSVKAYSKCGEAPFADETRTANEDKTSYKNHKDIEGYTESITTGEIYVQIYSEGLFEFSVIPYAQADSVIDDTVCPGTVFNVFGVSKKVEDLVNGDVIAHKEFIGAYNFHSAYFNRDFASDIDSVYTYDGILKETPDASQFALTCKPVILNGVVESASADAQILTAIQAWNASVDEDNDFFPVQIDETFSWAQKTSNTVTLNLTTECEPIAIDFVVDEEYKNDTTKVNISACVTPADEVVEHAIPGCDELKWFEVTTYINDYAGTPLSADDIKPLLKKFPVLINGEVAGLAEANADAQAVKEAYNAGNPDVAIEDVLGWNEAGDTVRFTALCGLTPDTLVIVNTPLEFNDNIVTTPLETVCDASEIPADEVTNCVDVNPYGDVLGQTCDRVTYTATVLNKLSDATPFVPTNSVVVGVRLNADPEIDAKLALAEAATFVATWNADANNSPITAEPTVTLDLEAASAIVTFTDGCGSTMPVTFLGDIHPAVFDTVYECAAKDNDTIQVAIAESTAHYDSVHVVLAANSIATATPAFTAVEVGEKADHALSFDPANLLAEVGTFVAGWNADVKNAPVSTLPTVVDLAVSQTAVAFNLTDDCGNVLPVSVAVNFHALVETSEYGCTPSADTTALPLGGTASYDSIHTVIEYKVAAGPAIDASLKIFCGREIDFAAAQTALAAALTANCAAEDVANVDVTTIKWFVNGEAYVNQKFEDGATVNVSYTVSDECGNVITNAVAIVAEQPTYEDLAELDNINALVNLGNAVLVVDIKAIKDTYGVDLKPEDVHWFKVGEAAELTAADGAKGFYLTPQTVDAFPIAGSYYVVFDVQLVAGDACTTTFRTIAVTAAPAASPEMFLAPNSVRPGETINLYNLDGAVATIAVYDMMGNMLSREQVSGVSAYSFEAQNNSGYYVVKVVNGERVQSLKYVVK